MVDVALVPCFAVDEVTAPRPGHVLVGEPFLGAGEVPFEQPLGDRREVGEESALGEVS